MLFRFWGIAWWGINIYLVCGHTIRLYSYIAVAVKCYQSILGKKVLPYIYSYISFWRWQQIQLIWGQSHFIKLFSIDYWFKMISKNLSGPPVATRWTLWPFGWFAISAKQVFTVLSKFWCLQALWKVVRIFVRMFSCSLKLMIWLEFFSDQTLSKHMAEKHTQ